MNTEEAMDKFEKGRAVGIFLEAILMKEGEHYWLSFDGKEWESNDSELIKKQF